MTPDRSSERGGMLVYIFIFAAMFVALSYAVSQSFKVGGGTGTIVSEEKMRLALTDIQNVVEQHRIGIHTMLSKNVPLIRIAGLYQEGPIDFYPWNGTCGWVDMTCRLYAPEGGGLKWFKFSSLYPDLTDIPNETGEFFYPNGPYLTPVSGRGTESADLVYNVRVTKNFCNFINKTLGVTTADADTTDAVSTATHGRLSGSTWSEAHNLAFTRPGQGGHLLGKTAGCFRNTAVQIPGGGTRTGYFFYNLIRAF